MKFAVIKFAEGKIPLYCQLTQNQPKSHILFHKNGSLSDFYIMTFICASILVNETAMFLFRHE